MTSRQLVVGALVVHSLGAPTYVLAARRTGPAALAGRWEFPGGKVEPGERPEDALARELREELSIEVELGDELVSPVGAAWIINESMEMRLWFATISGSDPVLTGSHDEIRWLNAGELNDVPWLEADQAVLPYVFR